MSEIRVGKLSFKVWELTDGRVAFDYQAGSKRIVVKRKDLPSLKIAAANLAPKILNGETEALALTLQDQRIYVAAKESLGSVPVDLAARDYAEALAIVGPGVSMRDLALFYKRAGKATAKSTVTVETAYERFLEDRGEHDLSSRHISALVKDTERFVRTFGQREIADIEQDEILQWLRGQQKERNLQWRRRNNIRDTIANFFGFAKKKGYLPHDRQTAAELVDRLPQPKRVAPIEIYSPAEMAALISHVKPRYLPWLLIGGFAGIRSEEIAPDPRSNKDPLRWEDFDWNEKVIRVRRESSKVGEPRVVPISSNLLAWLQEYHDAKGVVCPGEQPSHAETQRLSRVCSYTDEQGMQHKVAWKRNGLRHSYGSYRLAIIRNRDQLAEEMGNSVQMIRGHYNEARSSAEGEAWFAIRPKDEAMNVVKFAAS